MLPAYALEVANICRDRLLRHWVNLPSCLQRSIRNPHDSILLFLQVAEVYQLPMEAGRRTASGFKFPDSCFKSKDLQLEPSQVFHALSEKQFLYLDRVNFIQGTVFLIFYGERLS